MKARLRGANRDVERLGHRRDRHSDVVMEHEDRPLLGAEAAEATLELVTLRDERRGVADGRIDQRRKLDLDGPSPSTAQDIEAGVDRQSVKPDIEPIVVAQTRQVAPGSKACLLDRVSRKILVPEHESGDGFQPRDGRADERREGVMIAPTRSLDEIPPVHSHPR
jgi:hypothetical protein